MYKLRFKEWGLEKNIKSDEAKAMLIIRKRRRDELNTETEFVLRGKVVTDEKLDRFQKRLKIDVENLPTGKCSRNGVVLDPLIPKLKLEPQIHHGTYRKWG